MVAMGVWTEARVFWRLFVFVLTPLILLPLPIINTSLEARAGYGLLILVIYWITEAIPLAATSLLPMVVFPVLGVQSAAQVAKGYFHDQSMLILGGLMVAVSIENCNLHKRIALGVLRFVGTRPRWLMLGFMLPTWFLSMWISNTATTAMMFPIAQVVLEQFDRHRQTAKATRFTNTSPSDALVLPEIESLESREDGLNTVPLRHTSSFNPMHVDNDVQFERFRKGVMLSIAYGANIGGIATLTGSAPNVVFKHLVNNLYADKGLKSPINFLSWMSFGVPIALICIFFAWIWMTLVALGFKAAIAGEVAEDATIHVAVKTIIDDEFRHLGKLSYAEITNIVMFSMLAILWVFRESNVVPGWEALFKKSYVNDTSSSYVSDASSAILVAVFLFAIPSQKSIAGCFRRNRIDVSVERLLDWNTVHKKLPWGVIILMGGGFALAEVCKTSGLSESIGERTMMLGKLPPWVIVLLTTSTVAFLTEFTNNVATASIMLPILARMTDKFDLHPLYLMFPATIATSFAFMLPTATPPNAIVFAAGYIRVPDMLKAGIVLNIVCVLVTVASLHLWTTSIFGLNEPLGQNALLSTP